MENNIIESLSEKYQISYEDARNICVDIVKHLHYSAFPLKKGGDFFSTIIKLYPDLQDEGIFHYCGFIYKVIENFSDSDAGSIWDERVRRFGWDFNKFDSILDGWRLEIENKDSPKTNGDTET